MGFVDSVFPSQRFVRTAVNAAAKTGADPFAGTIL